MKLRTNKLLTSENVLYMSLWGLLFLAPIITVYVRSISDTTFSFAWQPIFYIWGYFLLYLTIFVLHNAFLAPLLVYKQRKSLYFTMVAVVLSLFIVGNCSGRFSFRPPMPPPAPRIEITVAHDDGHAAAFRRDQRPPHRPMRRPEERVIIPLVVLVLMFGMNIGVKFYYKSAKDAQRLHELERQNISHQLEYLKFQINPHFLMNTLNNIHALVDIDPERSKEAILQLSAMMRYMLYDGARDWVPLDREVAFLKNYINLMRLRYTDRLRIDVGLPASLPESTVPPLIFVTFVENAFMHGVSYVHPSFVEVNLKAEGNDLMFTCRNSKAEVTPDTHQGGVGLENVTKRLALIYGDRQMYDVQEDGQTYTVSLRLPKNVNIKTNNNE